MARTRDEQKFNDCRNSLLTVGQELFIASSFNSVGLNDIIRHAAIPKGSFYHYFESKEDFALQVVEQYHKENYAALEELLQDDSLSAYQQLKTFFKISQFSTEMVDKIASCIERLEDNELNLGHLKPCEAAQVLMNSWMGAIMKMKMEKSREPLDVFMKFFFAH